MRDPWYYYDFQLQLIPEGYYFSMGNNRGNSYDSRNHGPISEDSITGKVNK